MSKYIDADALMDELNNQFRDMDNNVYDSQDDALEDAEVSVRQIIHNTPAADVEPVREWISVEDKLPEIEQDVLVAFDDGFVATACIEKNSDWGLWQDSGEVTHWQPLPEPPKMDGGSE